MKKLTSIILLITLLTLAGCSPATPDTSTSVSDDVYSSTEEADAIVAEDYSIGLRDDGYFQDLRALDYVNLGDYKDISVPESVHLIDDIALQVEIDRYLANHMTTEDVTDKAVEDGDTVNIDFYGSVDGERFENGDTKGMGTVVTVGVTNYIDNFLDQLIGHMPGETFDVFVTFPEVYEQNPDLAGKDAVFSVTINHIKQPVLPELTDTFVAANYSGSKGWETAEMMTEGIRADLQEAAVYRYLRDYLLNSVEISQIPDAVYDYQVKVMNNYYINGASNYHMTLTDFLSTYTEYTSLEAIKADKEDELQESATWDLIVQAISEDNDVLITDDILDTYFIDNKNTVSYADSKAQFGMAYIKHNLLADEAKNLLIETALLQ